jgi:hypothetical protein
MLGLHKTEFYLIIERKCSINYKWIKIDCDGKKWIVSRGGV